MCTYVDVASFMALAFDEAHDKSSLTFAQLNELREAVEPALGKMNVAIDWSRDSYLFATGFYGNFFTENADGVECKVKEMHPNIKFITGSIPEPVCKTLRSSLAAVEKALA